MNFVQILKASPQWVLVHFDSTTLSGISTVQFGKIFPCGKLIKFLVHNKI